jgi:hypothetical protein
MVDFFGGAGMDADAGAGMGADADADADADALVDDDAASFLIVSKPIRSFSSLATSGSATGIDTTGAITGDADAEAENITGETTVDAAVVAETVVVLGASALTTCLTSSLT